MTSIEKPEPTPGKTVGAVDVGSNEIRMVIAQVEDDGRLEILEHLRRPVRMGQDTFHRGRLRGQVMRAALAVFRDYKQRLDLYQVKTLRAVATSAVREAVNADTFLDRVFMASGLQVEVIGTAEESRLTVSAVREAVGSELGADHDPTLIAEVGGGSTLLTVLEEGQIANSQSVRLGSIRLRETLVISEESQERSVEMLRQQIANMGAFVRSSLSLASVRSFVALGADVRFAADQICPSADATSLRTVEADEFDALVGRCQGHSAEELCKRYGLPFAEAETLVPALLIYQDLLHSTRCGQMIVSNVSMRDGLLLELARRVTGEEDDTLIEGVIHSAMAVAEKYRVDPDHAYSVADISVRLFDALLPDHGLGPRHRLLLRVAGLLHEVGTFVNSAAHHKHGYYLIVHSEIFGLDRIETELVAHVARYHRRSAPKPSHVSYMSLAREGRVIVNKLAAILRVADALSRGHCRHVKDLKFERLGDDFIIHAPGVSDFVLERRALAAKGDLFEDIYGMGIRLEEA